MNALNTWLDGYASRAQPLSRFAALFPFAITDVLILLFVVGALIALWGAGTHCVRKRSPWPMVIVLAVFCVLTIGGMLSFDGIWGHNYERASYASLDGLDDAPAAKEELFGTCVWLLSQANELRDLVREDANGVMMLSKPKEDYLSLAGQGYENAAELHPVLAGEYGSPRFTFFSGYLSARKTTGIYIPYTHQPLVNRFERDAFLPATIAHEAAHLRGFAREDEANFLAYVASYYTYDIDCAYSGTLLSLVHSMNALYDTDEELARALRGAYHEGIERDLKDNHTFWKQFDTPVAAQASAQNDAYLKSHGQEDGVKSYGRTVDLLIALWRKELALAGAG